MHPTSEKCTPGRAKCTPTLNPGVHLVSKLALFPNDEGDPIGVLFAISSGQD